MKRFLILGIFVGVFVALGMVAGYMTSGVINGKNPPDIQGLLWPNPKQLISFKTIDQEGNVFGLEGLRGKWSFLFFGYTHCPDVCPVTLAVFNQMLKHLDQENKSNDTQLIFVTVDSERDTTERLREYVNYFNSNIIGLGGSGDQVQSLASQIGVVHMPGDKSASGEYYVDHTASIFLIDPAGRLVSVFSAPHEADHILSRYYQIRRFIERQSST